MSDTLKFFPLYDERFSPEIPFVHHMYLTIFSLKEAIDFGILDWFLRQDRMTGFDYETNGLDACRMDFTVSGLGLAVKGNHQLPGKSATKLVSGPDNESDPREYTAVWIDFRHDSTTEHELKTFNEFLVQADKQRILMAHNCSYEFKVTKAVYGSCLWNLQDSRAYLVAGGFKRFALKMNAKTMVNAHDWEYEGNAWRKKFVQEGGTETDSWGKLPENIIAPYCAWDCVYTISMAEEIISRSDRLREIPDYPLNTPITQSMEGYRRQLILGGIIDDNGAPTTQESFDTFLDWCFKCEIQCKIWLAKHQGQSIEGFEQFYCTDLAVNEELPWPEDIEELRGLLEKATDLISLEKQGDEYNFDIWNSIVFNSPEGSYVHRKAIDFWSKEQYLRDSIMSSWRSWAGMGEILCAIRKEEVKELFWGSGVDLADNPNDVGIAIAKMSLGKQVRKMSNDALNFDKRDHNEAGQTLPVHKGRVETPTGRIGFSWHPSSKETRRWASGFHIITPRARMLDIFDGGPDRIQVHADLSGAEIQFSNAQAGDRQTLENFMDGIDGHMVNAVRTFGVDESQVTDEMRTFAKTITFRLLFGSTVEGIAGALGVAMSEATKIVLAFFAGNPELKKFLDYGAKFALDHHCRVSIWGDLLALPREGLSTKYHNYIVQHSNSNAFGSKLFDLEKSFLDRGYDSYLFGFVHDSMDISTHTLDTFRVVEAMHEIIVEGQLRDFGVPARLDYELNGIGNAKLHASHFAGTGARDNPWQVSLKDSSLVRDANLLLTRLDRHFNLEIEEVECKKPNKYTSIQDTIMSPHEWKLMPSWENERNLPKSGYNLTIWTEKEEHHTKDLKMIEAPQNKSLIDCNWPKAVAPMWGEAA